MSAYPFEIGERAVASAETMPRPRRMYRRRRHVCGATRRYYLLGRDRMIAELQLWLFGVTPRDELEPGYAVMMLGAESGKP